MVAGATSDPNCPEGQTDCPVTSGHTATSFLYGRIGVALRFGIELRNRVGVDGGLWYGTVQNQEGDNPPDERRLLWPMAGLSYVRAL